MALLLATAVLAAVVSCEIVYTGHEDGGLAAVLALVAGAPVLVVFAVEAIWNSTLKRKTSINWALGVVLTVLCLPLWILFIFSLNFRVPEVTGPTGSASFHLCTGLLTLSSVAYVVVNFVLLRGARPTSLVSLGKLSSFVIYGATLVVLLAIRPFGS